MIYRRGWRYITASVATPSFPSHVKPRGFSQSQSLVELAGRQSRLV